MDGLDHLRAASARLDADLVVPALRADVQLRAPVLSRVVFRGRDDVVTFFHAVFSIFDEVVLRCELTDGDRTRVLVLDCRFGRHAFTDALVVGLDEDGLVEILTPHLRPWPSSTLFILRAGARLLRHPGMLVRSLRGA